MGYTAPTTRVDGEFMDASDWNTDVTDNIAFLANPAACRLFHSTTQSIADNSSTTLTFDSETYDTDTMHSAGNPTRITFTTAGIYLITLRCILASGNDYVQTLPIIRKNGTTDIAYGSRLPQAFSATPILWLMHVDKFSAADYVEAQVYQDNSANAARNVTADPPVGPVFTATRLGAG